MSDPLHSRSTIVKTSKIKSAKKSLRGLDFLSVDDFSPAQIKALFDVAAEMKARPRSFRRALDGTMMALIFEKPSLRTRTTFTVGIKQLGGDALLLTPADISLGKRESVADVARNLERMVDGIMIRTFGHEICTALAASAAVPVINGLTDHEHPCQALADVFTLVEHKKSFPRVRIAFVGDGNNVAHSLALAAAKLGGTIILGTPPDHRPAPVVMERCRAIAAETGATVLWTEDPAEAVRGADAVYTDTWASMGQEAEAEARRGVFRP